MTDSTKKKYIIHENGKFYLVSFSGGKLNIEKSLKGKKRDKEYALSILKGVYVGRRRNIPEYAEKKREELAKKKKRAAKRMDDRIRKGQQNWEYWRSQYLFEDWAKVELIRYLNRFAKREDIGFTEKELIYRLKDLWMKENTKYLKDGVISREYYHPYGITRFFAYTFEIEGLIYQFHGKSQLIECRQDFSQHGSSKPLKDEDITIRLTDALLAACYMLNISPTSKLML